VVAVTRSDRPAAVLIDLYDTLVHKTPDGYFYKAVPAALGIDAARWLASYRKWGRAAMIGQVPDLITRVLLACADAGRPRRREEAAAVVCEHISLFYQDIRVDPDALELLHRLRAAGVRTAVVSNAASYSEPVLDACGLRSLVDAVVLSYAAGALKPDPLIYRVALAALHVPAEDAVFVGDGGDGELAGARAVGLRTVLVDRALPHTAAAIEQADVVCADLRHVEQTLLPITAG
jgi:putative hydrolase of the HAD superfamily